MTRFLFGQPGDFFDRHQSALLVALFLLIVTCDWLTATLARIL